MTLTNYNRELDENLAALWIGLFRRLDGRLFREACIIVIAENKFFPNAKEILDAYDKAKKAARERAEANRRALAGRLANAKCHLCDGGICFYFRGGHEYLARCVCARGADPGKFSEPQVRRDAAPEIDRRHYSSVNGALYERDRALAKTGANPYYLPTIEERLGDDFALWEARRMHGAVSGKALSAEEKAGILRGMGGARLAAESARFEEGGGPACAAPP